MLFTRVKRWAFIALCCTVFGCAHDPYSVAVIDATSANYGKNQSLYKVRKGDTLYSIAFRYNTTVAEITRLNNIKKPYTIHPGQQLLVLGQVQAVANSTHTVIKPKSKPKAKPVAVEPVVKTPKPVAVAPKVKPKPVVVKPAVKPKVKQKPVVTKPTVTPTVNRNEKWILPSKGRIGKGFKLGDAPHKGVDFHAGIGSPVVASRSGTVVYAGNGLKSYGLLVIIKHDDEYLSAYAYNRAIKVKEGQFVKQGQIIAEMGKKADTVLLHFEIRRNSKPINPIVLLSK